MSNIRCRIFDIPISYIKKYTTSYTITCIRHTISYTTSYKMYDIVCFWGGSCHFIYDVVYDIVYDVVCQIYDIVCQKYNIVYQIYDIVYDIV